MIGFLLIRRRPTRYKRTDTPFPYTTLFRFARVAFPLVQGVGIDIDCQRAVPSMSATGRRAKAGACRLSAERDGPGTVGGNRDAVALLAAQLQDRKSTRLHSSH